MSLADAQGGCVARGQLERLGASRNVIDGWVAEGWLIVLHLGVYAVGHRPRTHRGLAFAAVLACGPQAKASHGTAAACHALLRPYHRLHVSGRARRRRPGVVTHRATTGTVWIDGLPCTTVARTLLDLAGSTPFGVLESAVRQAQVRGVLDVEELARLTLACPRARGVRRLRAILGDPVLLAPTRSRPERLALQALLAAGWPWPQVGAEVHGEQLDFSWPGLRLGLEIDGPTHLTPVQAARDARRDAKLAALGWRIARVPATEAAHAPAALARVVDRPPWRRSIDRSTREEAAGRPARGAA